MEGGEGMRGDAKLRDQLQQGYLKKKGEVCSDCKKTPKITQTLLQLFHSLSSLKTSVSSRVEAGVSHFFLF